MILMPSIVLIVNSCWFPPSWPQIHFAWFPKIPVSYVLFAMVTGSSGSKLVCATASTLALVSSFRPFPAPDVVVSAGTNWALPRSCRFFSLPWLELLIPICLGIVQDWNDTSNSQLELYSRGSCQLKWQTTWVGNDRRICYVLLCFVVRGSLPMTDCGAWFRCCLRQALSASAFWSEEFRDRSDSAPFRSIRTSGQTRGIGRSYCCSLCSHRFHMFLLHHVEQRDTSATREYGYIWIWYYDII